MRVIWVIGLTVSVTNAGYGQYSVVEANAETSTALLVPLAGDSQGQMFAPTGSVFTVDGKVLQTLDGQNFAVVGEAGVAAGDVAIAGLADPPRAFAPQSDDATTVEVGFTYLIPQWDNDSFRNLLPAATVARFPANTLSTDVEHDFTFSPTVSASYQPAAWDGKWQTSGFLANLKGSVNQSANGATLVSESELNLVVANFFEIAWDRTLFEMFRDQFCCQDCAADSHLANTVIEFSFGGRAHRISQTYSGSLVQGGEEVTASSSQSFGGLGLTSSLAIGHPVTRKLIAYCRTRGSIVVGDNKKSSNFAFVSAADPTLSTSNSLSEIRTEVMPVGELEFAMIWHNKSVLTLAADNGVREKLLWAKVGFVGQVWGDAGMLSAGTNSEFGGGNLYIYGITAQVGLMR